LCRRPKKGDQEAQGLGRSRGGFTTKLHARCDGHGRPLGFVLTRLADYLARSHALRTKIQTAIMESQRLKIDDTISTLQRSLREMEEIAQILSSAMLRA